MRVLGSRGGRVSARQHPRPLPQSNNCAAKTARPLRRWGVTPYTLDLQYELERALARERGISLLPGEQLDAALDQLHIQAFPDPKDRPPRMTAGDTVDPRTDYTE